MAVMLSILIKGATVFNYRFWTIIRVSPIVISIWALSHVLSAVAIFHLFPDSGTTPRADARTALWIINALVAVLFSFILLFGFFHVLFLMIEFLVTAVKKLSKTSSGRWGGIDPKGIRP